MLKTNRKIQQLVTKQGSNNFPAETPNCFRGKDGEIPKQVTRRKPIKRIFFNISSNLTPFTDNFKTGFDVKFVDK